MSVDCVQPEARAEMDETWEYDYEEAKEFVGASASATKALGYFEVIHHICPTFTGSHIWWRTWVGLTWEVPSAGGCYCCYLLPKQVEPSQIKVNPTQVRHQMCHPV